MNPSNTWKGKSEVAFFCHQKIYTGSVIGLKKENSSATSYRFWTYCEEVQQTLITPFHIKKIFAQTIW